MTNEAVSGRVDTDAVFYERAGSMTTGRTPRSTPGEGEVQIDVAFNGICGTDLHIFHGEMDNRVSTPAIIGHEMSGSIATIGDGVEGWAVGDHVTVMPLDWCGDCPACSAGNQHICHHLNFVGIDSIGAIQQQWNVRAEWLVRLPEDLPLDVAALTEPLAVAVHDVARGGVVEGDFVVVIGGGPIGVLIGLVSTAAGASVLLSEPDAGRRLLAENLGLDTVNPIGSDLTALVQERTSGVGADVSFEVSATVAGAKALTDVLKVRGTGVVVGIHSTPPPLDLFQMFWRELELKGARVYERSDFEQAVEMLASGAIPGDRIISKTIKATDAQEAFEALEKGGQVLKVLIDCQDFT